MKKIFLLKTFLIALALSQFANAQNVGIGTLTPAYALTLQTSGASSNWGFMHTNGTVYLGSYLNKNGVAEFGTRSNHPLWFFTNNSDLPPALAIDATGKYVGINTNNPQTHLDIFGVNAQLRMTDLSSANAATISRYTNRLEIGVPDIFQVAMGTTANPSFIIKSNGYIGMGDNTPVNKLQIGTTPSFSGNDLAIGDGTNAMSFYTSGPAVTWFSNNNFSLMPNGGNGYVGIGTQNPVNKLQIGSMGSSGYGGNDIAFGNGSQVSGISQSASMAAWYSNTSIILMPAGNGHGRVGINTIAPNAPLEVDDYVQNGGTVGNQVNTGYDYFKVGSYNGGVNSFGPDVGGFCQTCFANVSILASDNVMALEFDVSSDARIKDIDKVSNSAKDLEILNKLQITDYTFKDKIKNGPKPFKKVIAQQIEEVYPQVINKSTNYIPNVYQLSSKIEKKGNGYLISFKSPHNISKEAKKLQLMDKRGAQQRYDIVAIPSDKEVLINATALPSDTVFVYGEQVNDFRTVDYDGLTTLNISATQELSKIIKSQQEEIKKLSDMVSELEKKISKLETKN